MMHYKAGEPACSINTQYLALASVRVCTLGFALGGNFTTSIFVLESKAIDLNASWTN